MKSDKKKQPAQEYSCPICGEKHKRNQLCPSVAEIMFDMDETETSRVMGAAFLECLKQKKDFSQMLKVLGYYISFFTFGDYDQNIKYFNADLVISYFAKALDCNVEHLLLKNTYLADEYAEIIEKLNVEDMNCSFLENGRLNKIDLELSPIDNSFLEEYYHSLSRPSLHLVKAYDGQSYLYYLTYKPSYNEYRQRFDGHYCRYDNLVPSSSLNLEGYELCSDKKGRLKDCFEAMYNWIEVASENTCSQTIFHGWIDKLSLATNKGYLDWSIKDLANRTTYSTRYGKSDIRIYIEKKADYPAISDAILIRENDNKLYCYEKRRNPHNNDDDTSPKNTMPELLQIPELRKLAVLITDGAQKYADGLFLQNNIEKKLKRSDTIAVTYSFMCSQKNHSIMPYCGIVPILSFDNQRIEEKVYLGYCRQCDLFYMFSRDYNRLSKKGTILCKVISASTGNTMYDPTFKFANETSILSQYGYNVQASNNLSFDDRKEILDRIIDDKAMSIHSMINLLEMQIHLHRKKRNYSSAVSKWEMDVDYLKGYGISSGREKHLLEENDN